MDTSNHYELISETKEKTVHLNHKIQSHAYKIPQQMDKHLHRY